MRARPLGRSFRYGFLPILIIAFLLPLFSHADLGDCTDLLLPEVTSMRWVDGGFLMGRIVGEHSEKLIGYLHVGSVTAGGRENLVVRNALIHPNFRRRGVMEFMLKDAVDQFTKRTKEPFGIQITHLEQTNNTVYLRELIAEIQRTYPGEVKSVDAEAIVVSQLRTSDNWFPSIDTSELTYQSAWWEKYFDSCCSKAAANHRNELAGLAMKAVEKTPAYRARIKLGFDKICAGTRLELSYLFMPTLFLCR